MFPKRRADMEEVEAKLIEVMMLEPTNCEKWDMDCCHSISVALHLAEKYRRNNVQIWGSGQRLVGDMSFPIFIIGCESDKELLCNAQAAKREWSRCTRADHP
jgi:hypothetical protein